MNTTAKMHPQLEREARKVASARLGWYVHALVYLCMNVLLALLSSMTGKHWAVFPPMAWGIGLAVHGAVVVVVTGRAGLHERLVPREREWVSMQSDPW